ncbi:MAG: ATP-binding cassette domain-containing protein [Treponema sp.]|jgi:ABC-type multidrug transport system ATPase subunit|nr:ATP-binding cassette domain-containing protein [Treponema sp.]
MGIIVELQNVSFIAENQDIVKSLSYQFEEGKATALVGPSGGGKSTVLKLAAGLLVPAQGAVYFRREDVSLMNRSQTLKFRRQAAFVFQDSALWANQSLYQNMELPLRIHFPQMQKPERDQRINEVLAEVAYQKDLMMRPSKLSMGEQKLIAFARAMLCRPVLLFLDEWTESLDERAAQRLINIVKAHKDEGHTIIFVSHDFRLVKYLADYVIMIASGVITMKFTGAQLASDTGLAQYIEKGINS